MTCLYRCGNACDKPVPNTTDNPYIKDVIEGVLTRRALFKAAGASALVVMAGQALDTRSASAAPKLPRVPSPIGIATNGDGALEFVAVAPNNRDELVVPTGDDYAYSVVMRWGDPVLAGAPAFDPLNQTASAQAQQFGYNCDYVAVLPYTRDGDTALLVVNHEYTDEQMMFPGVTTATNTTAEQKRIAMMAHGISVVKIERVGRHGEWERSADRSVNRRITVSTPFVVDGPAAGSQYLRTSADPTGKLVLGTLNNCAGGTTPWGTTLHGEENFNQYFGASTTVQDPERRLARYGIATSGLSSRRWEEIDPRFDLAKEPNEANRFGWVVEVDPTNPSAPPVKHTALGRFKHEGASISIAADGRAVAYSGDDERFDYIYKFVSRNKYRPGRTAADRAHNMTLLSEGDLYVAQFSGDSPKSELNGNANGTGTLPADGEFDGTGRWIPLVVNGQSMIPGKSVAWVLTFTRLAADRLGKQLDANGNPVLVNGAEVVVDPALVPTKMDRPEDIEPNPVTGRVYAALTNNSNRTVAQADEANPLGRSYAFNATTGQDTLQSGNRNGHVLEWEEAGNDHASLTFTWRIFIVAGDPERPETYFAGYDKSKVSPISCPDNVAFDPHGNLWISTDGNSLSFVNQVEGTTGLLGGNDGLFAVPVQGPERGHLKQFLTVPRGAETCGPLITWDGDSLFVAVQHPGEYGGATFDNPKSSWPDRSATRPFPRPSVAVVYKTRGDKRIGSGGRAARDAERAERRVAAKK
ncbi:PhoX family protein [Motilibacter aurantiacus]|uniref:PhoX family protein n=1 Tax=Motilibacter aurantiacus TaxID=2714955 RepID=UPI001409ED0B|nr:PhoX family phosphatase [Motilibacter aurantiacus]